MYDPVLQRRMFANGGMAQAQPPMMQQPIAPPMSSVGTGITSGLVDQAEDQLASEQGFAAMAGGMQDMLGQIDSAESTEEVINAMRGDEASLEQRYSELAGLVGKEDAKKTPESVLTLVQPTFSMMDLVQQEAPAGGIADAMPMAGGGTTPGNIDMASPIQAPGMGEAVARMQAGETPVRASTGLDVNLNRINVPTTNLNAIGGITSRQPIQMDLPNLGGLSMPPLRSMDQNRIRAYSY